MWEAFSMKNPKLMKNGLNLAILDIPQDDMTNNINLICPTSNYTIPIYDPSKGTVILVKNGHIYEPIYQYTVNTLPNNTTSFLKMFKSTTPNIGEELSNVLDLLKQVTVAKCRPISVNTNKEAIIRANEHAIDVKKKLESINDNAFVVKNPILNFQGKVVGLWTLCSITNVDSPYYNKPNLMIYVPTFPSSLLELSFKDDSIIYMDDPKLYQDYELTVYLLQHISILTKMSVYCKPVFKVVEKDQIVGILTFTNQFVQINPPILANGIQDNIPIFRQSNILTADISLQTGRDLLTDIKIPPDILNRPDYANIPPPSENVSRDNYINRLRLETQFYSAFRNTARILLGLYENRKKKQEILAIAYKDLISTFDAKRKKIGKIIKKVLAPHVQFSIYEQDAFDAINEVTSCVRPSNYCHAAVNIDENGQKTNLLKLVIPSTGLATGNENETNYYLRLSDELLRYKIFREDNEFVEESEIII